MRSKIGAEDLAGQLFDAGGRRKYVTAREWRRFLEAANDMEISVRAFCYTLAFTGCRISEALALTSAQVDFETGCIVLRTLKRRRAMFRAIPVPPMILRLLAELAVGKAPDERLWRCCRQTAWRWVCTVMARAAIEGPHACPKGLRHGFGIAAAEESIPPALTQRWMGHARLETTALYQHAVGREERAFARRLWRDRLHR